MTFDCCRKKVPGSNELLIKSRLGEGEKKSKLFRVIKRAVFALSALFAEHCKVADCPCDLFFEGTQATCYDKKKKVSRNFRTRWQEEKGSI